MARAIMASVAPVSEAEARARAALITVDSYQLFVDLSALSALSASSGSSGSSALSGSSGPSALSGSSGLSGSGAGPVRTRVTVRFRCAEPGAATFADVRATVTGSAVLNGAPLPGPVDGRLALASLAAENTLTVEAQAPPERVLTLFTDPSDGAGYAQVVCYPTDAPALFCCFDQLDLPAAMTLSVAVPAGWECVSNGAVTERVGAGEWRFSTVPAMKVCDLTLVAGPFAAPFAGQASGRVAMSVRCRASLAADGSGHPKHLGRFGEIAMRALEDYERRLAVPCPYDAYDIVFVPELAAAALSVPGLMLAGESLLERMADPDDDFVAMVCAHEVAHLWFGSLVSARWWDDLWLDEAMATYLSYQSDADWAAFSLRSKADALRVDGLPETPPVSSPVASMTEALNRPNAITYSKGASVVRQLCALIGADAVRAGLTDYLRSFGGGNAGTGDLVGCWSRAAGRDLTGWAREWLQAAGSPELRAELSVAPDGTIATLAIAQSLPRTQWVGVGLFERDDATGGLRARRVAGVELSGALTAVPGVAGEPVPDAVILNAGDWAFADVVLDDQALGALAGAAFDLGDPLTEAACWNAAWHMLSTCELAPDDFITLVTRRLGRFGPLAPAQAEVLLDRAVTCTDRYAAGQARAGLREHVAAAALETARRPSVAPPLHRVLLAGFAAAAESAGQLATLRTWLGENTVTDAALRGKVVATLSARGLAGDDDLRALAEADPVAGETTALTCRAMRPDPVSKEEAWRAALDSRASGRLAVAHAEGVWVPGQEAMMTGFGERYFAQALPALSERDAHGDWPVQRTARRLAARLFPATLDARDTLAATQAALASDGLTDPIRTVLLREAAELRSASAARDVPAKLKIVRKRSGNR